jgi:signal transduction histidine kinase/CHASE3 domain sensor protein
MLPQTASAIFRRRLARAIVLPIVLLLLLSGISIWQITQLLAALRWINHTSEVIAQANQVQKLFLDLETGVRGYLLSQDPEFLVPYRLSRTQIDIALSDLQQLVDDNPAQVQRVADLQSRLMKWDSYTQPSIEQVQQEGTVALPLLQTRKQHMDRIREQMNFFIDTEEQLREQRTEAAQRTTQLVILSSVGLALIIGSILAYFIWRQLLGISRSYEAALQTVQTQTEQAQRSAHRLEDLHAIDRAILTAQSLESLAHAALSQLANLVSAQRSVVLLFNAESAAVQVLAGASDDLNVDEGLPLPDRLWLERIEKFQSTRYIPDLAMIDVRPPLLERSLAEGYRSLLTVALQVEDAIIGELVLLARTPCAFTAEHQQIAQEVADQLAIAIQQSSLRDQLQAYASQLEQRVAERTAQLEDTNQELEAFSYSVSHDLRAPLRTIQGFAQALLEDYGDQLDDVGKSYLQSVMDDAKQMDVLINDLLTYSRLSRTQIQLHPVDLTIAIEEAMKQLNSAIQETQTIITVKQPMPMVLAHRPTLIQVLANLLSNAIKFVDPGIRPQVNLYTEADSEFGPDWIRLCIVDNGIGIASAHQERIFRVFERLHGIESYPGTGIGLAIVRKGVERMGGRVGVQSQLGQGSQFWFALPRAVLDDP